MRNRFTVLIVSGIALIGAYLLRRDVLLMQVGALLLLAGVFGPRLKVLHAGPSGLRMELKQSVVRRIAEKVRLDAASDDARVETERALAAQSPETFADSIVDLVRLGTVVIAGQVTDAATRAPLDNVAVYVGSPGAKPWAVTNKAGQYVVDFGSAGVSTSFTPTEWELHFSRGGYERAVSPRFRLAGKPQIINIEMSRNSADTPGS